MKNNCFLQKFFHINDELNNNYLFVKLPSAAHFSAAVFIKVVRSPVVSFTHTQQKSLPDCSISPGNVSGQDKPRQIRLLKMTCSRVHMIAKTATIKIIPSTAACIFSRAAATASLSPPEV